MGSSITGGRERALFCQTLAPLIRGLEGREIVVELKNEVIIYGTLVEVDCFMNLTLKGVRMVGNTGKVSNFDFFFLQGKKSLRYVRIPDDINMGLTLKDQLDIVTGAKGRKERKKAKEKRANWLRRKEAANMATDVATSTSTKEVN